MWKKRMEGVEADQDAPGPKSESEFLGGKINHPKQNEIRA